MNEFETRIDRILADFGIDRAAIGCPLHEEAGSLVSLGEDMFGREQFATPETGVAWQAMWSDAAGEGIELQLVSAFRSVDYQCELIRAKLDRGLAIDAILKVNAAPGFSEHHTGRALDLATPGCEVLVEAFETTEAFEWLCRRAADFGFVMSYPRDNPFGIDYEPWHWAYERKSA